MKTFTRILFYALNIMVVAFARGPSDPVCSRYDYEAILLERLLSDELDLKNMLKEIRETHTNVQAALKVLKEDKVELATAITIMKKTQDEIKLKLDYAINGAVLNISEAVAKMKTNTAEAIKQMERQNTIVKDQLVIPTIYFYARTPASSSVSPGQTVIYTAVDINTGQGYDPKAGRFTVSVPGLYAFAVQYCIQAGHNVVLEIVNQAKTLKRASSFNVRTDVYPCVSMQVFIKADVSDKIWVKSTWSTSQLYSDSHRYNSFSGALVHL